jgi:hypothetical protein
MNESTNEQKHPTTLQLTVFATLNETPILH